MITEGTRYIAEAIPIDAGTIASFVASGYAPAPRLDASATWFLGNKQTPRIKGSVTNTTDVVLENAVILIKGEVRFLGTMTPGETRTFDITIGPQDPGPLTLGNPSPLYAPYAYNSWQYSSGVPGWCFSYRGIALTIPDVMRGEPFSCSTSGVSSRQQEIRRRYRLLGTLVVDSDLSGGRDSGAYLFAWANAALVEVELLNKSKSEEDTTLYIFELPVKVVASDPVVEIPPGLTTWTLFETDDPATLLDVSPVSFQISSGNQAAFQFMPMPRMRLAAVEELDINFQGQGTLVVEVWDWVAQAWVGVSLDPGSTSTTIPHAERFAGPENAVNVRIVSQDVATYTYVDYIKVAYRGRLVAVAAESPAGSG